jgi:hypothetical protein
LRLFEHLRAQSAATQAWQQQLAGVVMHRDGATHADAGHKALKMLQEAAATQSATLAYADAFLAMAAVGCLAVLLIPIAPPTPPAKKLFG